MQRSEAQRVGWPANGSSCGEEEGEGRGSIVGLEHKFEPCYVLLRVRRKGNCGHGWSAFGAAKSVIASQAPDRRATT